MEYSNVTPFLVALILESKVLYIQNKLEAWNLWLTYQVNCNFWKHLIEFVDTFVETWLAVLNQS